VFFCYTHTGGVTKELSRGILPKKVKKPGPFEKKLWGDPPVKLKGHEGVTRFKLWPQSPVPPLCSPFRHNGGVPGLPGDNPIKSSPQRAPFGKYKRRHLLEPRGLRETQSKERNPKP